MNTVILTGHVGQDPEFRKGKNDKQFATFSIAQNESYTKPGGERVENTIWHDIVVFAPPLVDIVRRFVKKGTHVLVQGALSYSTHLVEGERSPRKKAEIKLLPYTGQLRLLDSRRAAIAESSTHEAGG